MTTSDNIWLDVFVNKELIKEASESNPNDVASIAQLRKTWSQKETSIAFQLIEAQERAKNKWKKPHNLLADSEGTQQCTSWRIAEHKAKRFFGEAPIYDLCCGIGGDLQSLPMQAIGVDIDETRCIMARHNSKHKVICKNILELEVSRDSLLHIDPARRGSGKRLHTLESMQPNLSELNQHLITCKGGAIKVSPGIQREELENFPVPFELEFIEEQGRVVQCVIWFGSLALHEGQTTATSLSLSKTYSSKAEISQFNKDISGFLLEPNPALERSGLHCNIANTISAYELAPQLGLFCMKKAVNNAWFKKFEVLGTTSLRIEKVKKELSLLGCTQVEVKTRGKVIDPNEWQNKLTTNSSGELLTLFALRLGRKRIVAITRRAERL